MAIFVSSYCVYVALRVLCGFSCSSGRLQGGSQTARSVEALQAGSEKRWASDLHNGSQSSYLPASVGNTIQAQQTPVAVHPTIPLPESFSSCTASRYWKGGHKNPKP